MNEPLVFHRLGTILGFVHTTGTELGSELNFHRVATFRFRLNSLCFPCVHDQFPCVFQYINNKYYFYKWPPPPFTAIFSSLLFNNNIKSSAFDYKNTLPSPCCHFNNKIFPVLAAFSLCKKNKFTKFPVFSLSGKVNSQIPCFPCAVATLFHCYSLFTVNRNRARGDK